MSLMLDVNHSDGTIDVNRNGDTPVISLGASKPAVPIRRVRKICCIGAGYVGGPTSAVIAHQAPHIECTVVDLNQVRIDAWKSQNLPIYEPNLAEIVIPARDGNGSGRRPNLFFTTDLDRAIGEADIVFVSVNTPTKVTGTGAGKASDLGWVESAVRKIAEISTSDKIIVEKSTVPCRTAETIRDTLAANGRPGVRFDILSNPEFLAEGTAINDLLYPDRILIGSLQGDDGDRAAAALVEVYANWVPRSRIITMNLWSSELAKLAANALLAQRISSINALSAVCEAAGANISEVAFAVGLDKRIGPHMLKSSVGFGGSCFKKDILNLVYLSESLHLPEVAAYWKSVVDINEWQKDRFTRRVIACLNNTLSNKRVTILGFAYKKNTGDTRESAAITIVNRLIEERAEVAIYDPQVMETQIWQDLNATQSDKVGLQQCVKIYNNAYDACVGSSAIVIVTEWDDFKCDSISGSDTSLTNGSTPKILTNGSATHLQVDFAQVGGLDNIGPVSPTTEKIRGTSYARPRLDWRLISRTMRKPMYVFDGRNIVNRAALQELGFRVECIGVGRDGA